MRLTRLAPLAVLILLSVGIGACGQAKDFIAKQSEDSEALAAQEEAAAEAERLAAEVQVLEEEARAQALARAEAEAQAQAEAAQEALEAEERQLAEQKALLAQKEEQLRRQKALQDEKERVAARQAALEEKEQALFERERELEAREVNMAVAEDELRARAAEERPLLEGRAYEPDGWTGEVRPIPSDHAAEGGDTEGVDPGDYSDDVPPQESSEYSPTASLQPGKVMEVEILETISSSTHRLGDTFSGRLVQDLRAEDGTVVIPAGAGVEGEVVEVTPLKRVGGQASIGIEFTRIIVSPGESVEIRASVSELGADKSKDKKKIIGATIAGAILGRVLGGKGSENAVLGAAVGAAAGTAATARTKGKDAVIPAGEMIALQLEEVVTVEIGMTGTVEPE